MKRKSILSVLGVVSMFSIAALVWVAPANAQKIGRVSLKRSQSPAINEPSADDPVRMSCWTGDGDPVH